MYYLFRAIIIVAALSPLGAVGAEKEQPQSDPVVTELHRVAKMSFAEQQAWLKQLEQRADRAAEKALGVPDAAREKARVRAALHQEMVGWEVLKQIVDQANRWELQADGPGAARRTRVAAKVVAPTAATPLPTDLRSAPKEGKIESGMPSPPAPLPKGEGRVADRSPPPAPLPANGRPGPSAASVAGAAPAPPASLAKKEGRFSRARVKGEWEDEAVEVDVVELTARINGSNLAMKEMAADLNEEGTWNAARLEPIMERLKVLVLRRGDLAVYRELLSAKERGELPELKTAKAAISDLDDRIIEARKLAAGARFQGTETDRKAELQRLEKLTQELAELAKK